MEKKNNTRLKDLYLTHTHTKKKNQTGLNKSCCWIYS